MIYIPRFDSFNMASFLKKISPTSWLSLAAVVLIVASAIGMIFIDQINRAKLEECNKHIGCSSSLNLQFPEMKTDASSIRSAPHGKSPPELELRPGTSTKTLQTLFVPPERVEATIVPQNRN
jgi:hypothetical protein